MRRFRIRPPRRDGVLAAAALAAVLLSPRAGRAQFVSSSLGFLGGVVAGAHMSTGIYVLRSRLTGWNFHSPDDILKPRIEMMPIIVTPIAGAVLGARSSTKLGAAAGWGGAGIVGGAAIGATLGHLISGDTQGRWAGGTIGSAAGLLIGAVLGSTLKSEASDEDDAGSASRPRYITFSIPVGGF
jgi:hypothetical protein